LLAGLALALAAPDVAQAAGEGPGVAQYVFVIDDSKSMRKKTRGGPAADPNRLAVFAVRSLVSLLDDGDEVSVVRLNGPSSGEATLPIRPLAESRADVERLLALKGTLAAYGGDWTPCRSALESVRGVLEAAWRPGVVQVVLFLTDGACEPRRKERPDPDKLLEGLRSHAEGTLLFNLLRFRGRAYTKALERLARMTGGAAVEVGAEDPTAMLAPFARVLSHSQGSDAVVLRPGKADLPAHEAARRVRLLAVAPGRGEALSPKVRPLGSGKPHEVEASEAGEHAYGKGRSYRWATLKYKPGGTPVRVKVGGAGKTWKVVALPEYRLRARVSARDGLCGERGPEVRLVDVGANVCLHLDLVNEHGKVVTDAVAGDGRLGAAVWYRGPGEARPRDLPADAAPGAGRKASFVLERANLAEGDHVFRPQVLVQRATGTSRVPGRALTVQVSTRRIEPQPRSLSLGELKPGDERYQELRFNGTFPASRGRLVVEGREALPRCVRFSLSGKPEGEVQEISPGQQYSLAVQVDPCCGATSFTRKVETALRFEFDRAANARPLPAVVIPVSLDLAYQVTVPETVPFELVGGQAREVRVPVGGNRTRALVADALLAPPKEARRWPDEGLLLGFADEDGSDVQRQPDGEPAYRLRADLGSAAEPGALRLLARADTCCPGGSFESELVVVAPGCDPIRIPATVQVTSAGTWACWGPLVLKVIGGLLLLLLLLYLVNMFRNSRFISRKDLEARLLPLRWDANGQPEEVRRQKAAVAGVVRRGLRLDRRAVNWLKANPLVFGLPGGGYTETVELRLKASRRAEQSSLRLIPKRDHRKRLEAAPKKGQGRVFFNGSFYAVPKLPVGEDGEPTLLNGRFEVPFDVGEEPRVKTIPSRRQLLVRDEDREEGNPAGWLLR